MRFHFPSKPNRLFQLFFWVVYFLFSIMIVTRNFGAPLFDLVVIFLTMGLVHIVAINVHLYFLYPNFWLKKKRFSHLGLTCVLMGITILIKVGLFEFFNLLFVIPEDLPAMAPITSIISTLFLFTVTLPFLFFDYFIDKERLKAQLAAQTYESEIRFLRAQLNPHFMFNVLNNIYSMIFTGSKEAGPTVLKLSEFMRYMLYESGDKMVPLQQEASYLQRFVDLQTMKQGAHSTVSFEIGEIPPELKIPPLLLIPFLENAFKHSNWDAESGLGWIKGNLSISNGTMYFNLSNTLKQVRFQPEETGGIGLQNTRQRLVLLFPDQYKLEVGKQADVFTVNLSIDLKQPAN